MQAAAPAIAILAGDLPAGAQARVPGHQRGVYHHVGSGQRLAPIGGLMQIQLDADLLGVARAQGVDRIQPRPIDIHEAHGAAAQAGRQADIADDPEREDRAARADNADLMCHYVLLPVLRAED